MTSKTYAQITAMINAGTLVEGEEYVITDYPNFQVHVTATSANTLSEGGYTTFSGDTENSPLVYTVQGGEYGTVKYLSRPEKGISAYFDWTRSITGTSENIEIGETKDENGNVIQPNITISNSSNVSISGEIYGTWLISGSEDLIVGYMNEDLDIENSSFVTIGDNNEAVTITGSEGVLIGDGNYTVSVSDADGVELGSDNEEVTITAGNNIGGSRNKGLTVSKISNEIGSSCRSLTVDAKWNKIDKTINGAVYGNFSKIEESDSVELDRYSVGNDMAKARIITLEKVNNNYFNTSNMSLTETPSFNSYRDVNKIRTFEDIGKSNVAYQADNFGTVLNVERNKINVADMGAMDYEMMEGVWMAKTHGTKATTDMHYTIRINVPPELAEVATFHGAGTYERGDEVEIYATGSGFTILSYIDNVNGIVHREPTWTFEATSNMVIIPQYIIS